MQQVVSVWLGLGSRQRIIAMMSALIMFAAVLGISRLAITPSMSLLYSGLEAASAGEVVKSLEQAGVKFDIRRGSIFVEAGRRDELRLTLAAEGLPATNGKGYELLDSLSGFGTTAQMFDAAYWRAKEGELARTILSSPQIRSARVHIANATSQGFRKANKMTASVTVMGSSGSFSTSHARALKYLVASAVTGLTPENVSIIDGRNGLVVSGEDIGSGSANSDDRESELKKNVERLLEARVGPGNAVVEVSVEIETESESITERRFDPEGRVAISTDSEETSTTSTGSSGGAVTVASNLPDGDSAGEGSNSSSQNSETRETVNFEVSETKRELLRVPGSIRRISVAVLLDGIKTENPTNGETEWAPRSDEELDTLRELVTSAVGLNTDRGDTLTLKSLQFESVATGGTIAAPTLLQKMNLDVMRLIQISILAIVTLILGIFVFRPIFTRPPTIPVAELPGPRQGKSLTGRVQPANIQENLTPLSAQALTGEIDDSSFVPRQTAQSLENATGIATGTPSQSGSDDPVQKLRQLISDRQDETIDVLRTWMEDKEENV